MAGLCVLSLAHVPPAFALSVIVHGGAGRIGGSCASVRGGETHVLVDCGALGGEPFGSETAERPEHSFPFNPSEVSAVCLTHAHQDHAGRIPALVLAGFRGRIYMTEPTRELLRVSWKSQIIYEESPRDWRWSARKESRIYLHWRKDCPWSIRIAPNNLRTFKGTYDEVTRKLSDKAHPKRRVLVCGACREGEVADLMSHVTCVPFGETNKINKLSIVFSPTKHLPGAASVRLWDDNASCLFSGDVGTCRSRLVTEVPVADSADAVFVESTYGAATDASADATEADYRRFRQRIGETLKNDGLAWIPAFALDRTQRVLLEIKKGMDEGVIPADVPLYMLSPSARDNTALYVAHPEWFDVSDTTRVKSLFDRALPALGRTKPEMSKRAILLTTSGMMDTASSLSLLPALAPRPDVTICLVGYQAPGTPGFKLSNQATKLSLKIKDEKVDVHVGCRVEKFSCFGGHGDAQEMDGWLAHNLKSKIYLVHGEGKALASRREDLVTRLGCDVEVAKPGESYEILSRGGKVGSK